MPLRCSQLRCDLKVREDAADRATTMNPIRIIALNTPRPSAT